MMHRTQLSIDDEEFERLKLKAIQEHKSISAVIRESLRRVTGSLDLAQGMRVLDAVAGLWEDRSEMAPTGKLVRRLRGERRLERLARRP